MPEIRHIPCNPSLKGMAEHLPEVEYSALGLKATLILPWNREPGVKYPAIVFVQGSAWTFPDRRYELPQLGRFAEQGYAVMTVTHRNREDGHPFPAFLQDVKCAIRYLRAHAEEYHVDRERIGIWGTSSGGNTAMLVQLTGDDPAFRTEEYPEESDRVACAVECFGPSDMMTLCRENWTRDGMVRQLAGDRDPMEVARAMSPLCVLQGKKDLPPLLMLHGDADEMVDYGTQCLPMYQAYLEAGADVRLICVDGAPHEGSFWSDEVCRAILAFLDEHLKG